MFYENFGDSNVNKTQSNLDTAYFRRLAADGCFVCGIFVSKHQKNISR